MVDDVIKIGLVGSTHAVNRETAFLEHLIGYNGSPDETQMIDDTPYLIVDNQKISPIGRSPKPASASRDAERRDERPFGVVDRVTLSREGREKSRRLKPPADAMVPMRVHSPQKPGKSNPALLTYSLKQLR